MRYRMSGVVPIFLAMVMISSLFACPSQALAAANTVKLALFGPMSGAGADQGAMMRAGVELAISDINAAGGIKSLGGAKLELLIADVTSDVSQSPVVVERVLSQTKVSAGICCGPSKMTLPALPVLEKYKTPMLTAAISEPITSQGYKYIFSAGPKGNLWGEMQMDFLGLLNRKYGVDVKKLGVVYENSAYGISTTEGLRRLAEKRGYQVVFNQSFTPGLSDAGPLVSALRSAGAQVIFPAAYTVDATQILTSMQQLNYHPLVVANGGGFAWPDAAKVMGVEKVNGMTSVIGANWDSKNITSYPELVKITERYKQKTGEFMSEPGVQHYAHIWIIKEALEKAASTDSVKVRDAIRNIKIASPHPASIMQPGRVEFDDTGSGFTIIPVIIQWQKGEPRTVFPEELASSPVMLTK